MKVQRLEQFGSEQRRVRAGTRAHEEIRGRAYEIYLERGGQPGDEMDDWLQAERELERLALPKAN